MSILLIVLLSVFVGLPILGAAFFFFFFRVVAPKFFKESNRLFNKMGR